ncbi:MAG: hypothetical protein CMN78_03030 [Spirochaetales bacterium]|nr:hypothetical protein [Spirochaetales bacterium]
MNRKHFLFVTCRVIQRESYLCAAKSPHLVDIHLMPQGLHNQPEKLQAEIQKILATDADNQGKPYDAILLGYGLCSNGTMGIEARIQTVIPRGHDCITLILGSKEAYRNYFDAHRGIYWYSAGWIENNTQPSRERYQNLLESYKEKYGEDNAEYLMEMEQSWIKEYSRATYIDWGLPESEMYRAYTKECAEYLGWEYDELKGDPDLLQRLCDGRWDKESFLVLNPGQRLVADPASPEIIRAEDAESP